MLERSNLAKAYVSCKKWLRLTCLFVHTPTEVLQRPAESGVSANRPQEGGEEPGVQMIDASAYLIMSGYKR